MPGCARGLPAQPRGAWRSRHGDPDVVRAGLAGAAEARADGRLRVRRLIASVRRLRSSRPRLTKSRQAVLATIADDCGLMRAPVDGARPVDAARKLAAQGFGRFEKLGRRDRETKGRVRYVSSGLDGTKIKANASRHKALSRAHANPPEKPSRGEVEKRMRLAEPADNTPLDIPAELKRREARPDVIAAAKEEIEARARARFEAEQAEHERRPAEREACARRRGRRPGDTPPKAPEPGSRPKDQVNLTDEESPISASAGGGFEQAYNAQAGVDVETHLIVEQHLTMSTTSGRSHPPWSGSTPSARSRRCWPIPAITAGRISSAARPPASSPAFTQRVSATMRRWPSGSTPTRRPRSSPAPRRPTPIGCAPARARRAAAQAQGHRRAGLRRHQAGAGIPPVSCCAVCAPCRASGRRSVTDWNLKRLFALRG
jgi:hypothetical protein